LLSANFIRVLIAGALLAHGIAHAVAVIALGAQSLGGPTASRVSVRSWLFASLSLNTIAAVALPFWILSTFGFLAAAMSFWGILVPGDAWRQLAIAGAIVSILGIVLFSGIWPGSLNQPSSILNTFVALVMNIVILDTQLWLHWPPQVMFGK